MISADIAEKILSLNQSVVEKIGCVGFPTLPIEMKVAVEDRFHKNLEVTAGLDQTRFHRFVQGLNDEKEDIIWQECYFGSLLAFWRRPFCHGRFPPNSRRLDCPPCSCWEGDRGRLGSSSCLKIKLYKLLKPVEADYVTP